MRRVLVTGASGFIGANLVRQMVRDGYVVHVLLRPEYINWRIQEIENALHKHILKFSDSNLLNKVIGKIKPDWIFHLAAYGSYSFQNKPNHMIQTNISNTLILLNACIKTGFECFVNAGSSSEYGYKDHAPHENESIEPNSQYAITKSAVTEFCRYESRRSNLKIVTLRLYNIFGPYEDPRRFIPTLIVKGLQSKLTELVDPAVSRDFTYIEDVNDAFILTCKNKSSEYGEIYNVGTGVQITIRDAVILAQKHLNIREKPRWNSMPNRQWDTPVWICNNNKIRRKLGWRPRYSFEQGFAKTLMWFQQNPKIYNYYLKHS